MVQYRQTMPREDYIATIGLEVHCQLKTKSKMFCACPAEYGADPNTLTCPVCLGLPGALPVLNKAAIEMTVLAGMLLGCSTPPVSKWDRKNYFYPDMPKDYQITQFDLPLCIGGGVPLYDFAYPKDAQKDIANPGKVVKLTRIHLEEDVAKSTHHENSSTIDFNRAGTPLMEIVSDPDIESAEETVAYLNSLRQILIYGDLSDADMEKGQMRCDVNISIRPKGTEELGAKIELKNLNSVSAVRRAIHYEIPRQVRELDAGRPLSQATWRWDDDLGETPERARDAGAVAEALGEREDRLRDRIVALALGEAAEGGEEQLANLGAFFRGEFRKEVIHDARHVVHAHESEGGAFRVCAGEQCFDRFVLRAETGESLESGVSDARIGIGEEGGNGRGGIGRFDASSGDGGFAAGARVFTFRRFGDPIGGEGRQISGGAEDVGREIVVLTQGGECLGSRVTALGKGIHRRDARFQVFL